MHSPKRNTTPRRGGFETRPLHPRSVNPRAPIVIPSEAEGSKTNPRNSPHNPRPDPRHTGAGRYPEVPGWTQSRPNSPMRNTTVAPRTRNPPHIVIPSEAEGSKTVALRQPSKLPHNPRAPDPANCPPPPPSPTSITPAHPYNLSSRAKPRDLRLLPCANPRNRRTTLARTPVIPAQAGRWIHISSATPDSEGSLLEFCS